MGWTPIKIKTIINEALIHAHQQGREFLTYKDWLSAADERTLGLQQPIRAWNVVDRRKTAYHEAGHAVAARYLQPENRISKASIIRRGHALGYVQQQPREERTSLYARSIETSIMVSLAGHVIESRFLDSLTTGPSSDLESATAWAEAYVGSYAMGPTKLILPVVNSAAPAGPVLTGAHELLDQLYEETDRLLHEKEPAIHYLARALIEHGELIGEELEAVFIEIETTYPYLRRPFERKVLQFRPFGRDMRPEEAPKEPVPEEEAAAADAPAADGGTGRRGDVAAAASAGRGVWLVPGAPSGRGARCPEHAGRRRAALGAPLATSYPRGDSRDTDGGSGPARYPWLDSWARSTAGEALSTLPKRPVTHGLRSRHFDSGSSRASATCPRVLARISLSEVGAGKGAHPRSADICHNDHVGTRVAGR